MSALYLPWRLCDDDGSAWIEDCRCEAILDPTPACTGEQVAVVRRAVNAHEALVAALKAAIPTLEKADADMLASHKAHGHGHHLRLTKGVLDGARSALALAGESEAPQ